MGGTGLSSSSKRAKLSKSHTLPVIRPASASGDHDIEPEASHSSATGRSERLTALEKQAPPPREGSQRERSSILSQPPPPQQYAYGVAEGAAEPWRVAAAVGRDVGQYVWGRIGWKPSSALPEKNDDMCQHDSCTYMKARLKKQAQERAEREALEREEAKSRQSAAAAKAAEGKPPDEPKEAVSDETASAVSQKQVDSDSSSSGQDEKAREDGKGGEQDLSRISTMSSNVSGDITITGSGHYDPKNDVILRLETMTMGEVRFMNIFLWTWLLVAFVFLVYEFIRKLTDPNAVMKTFNAPIINAVLGSFCLVLVTVCLCSHFFRIYQTRKYKKIWKPRRLKYCLSVTIELVAQWVNLIFFLIPNFESFGPRCFRIVDARKIGYYSIVRWTCWNTLFLMSLCHAHNTNHIPREAALTSSAGVRESLKKRRSLQSPDASQEDMAVMDLTIWQAHKWKFAYWVLVECAIVASIVHYIVTVGGENPNYEFTAEEDKPCSERMFNCSVSKLTIGLVAVMVFFVLVYFFMYCYYITRAFQQLRTKSNVTYKIANIVVRLQARLRLPAFGFFMLSLVLLWFVEPFSCNSVFDTWFGMLPGQLAATVSVLLLSFVGTPKSCGGQKPILQVWLQEFSWLEADKARKLERRSGSLPVEQRDEIGKEPMFCVETMMHCLYWSLLVYDYREVEDSRLGIEEACGLFNPPLDDFELFWEKSLDTKMLLAWSREQMILAFRGTASLANVAADLQAWRSVHEPARGPWWDRPKVHSGFDKAWRNNNFNVRVTTRIKEIINSGQIDKAKLKVFVTGHSLGGALATLAAYDMRAIGKKYGKDCKVSCYTFGAPRTGNRPFARDFQDMVPDCWHIINDQDVVARGAKFLGLYKRGGHRVLINQLGDLIVRPNAIEASIRLVPCAGSVQQHLLTQYLVSLREVLMSQFSAKRMLGGMTGVIELARNNIAIKRLLLEDAGLTFEDLVRMSRWGAYAPKVAAIADIPITARKTKSLAKEKEARKLPDPEKPSTRGGLLFSCCASTSVKVREAKGDPSSTATDANVVDGGDVEGEEKV